MSRLRKAYKSKLEKMPDGGNSPRYIPSKYTPSYRDNTSYQKNVAPQVISTKGNITTLLKDPAYQTKSSTTREVNPTLKKVLKSADIATDVLQLGHFIPDPFGIGQTAGLIGDVVGKGVDYVQSAIGAYEGDYANSLVNLGYAKAPDILKNKGYQRANSLVSGRGTGMHYPLSPVNATLGANPVIKRGLNYNKGFLGATAAEINSNINKTPSSRYTNPSKNIQYSDNTRIPSLLNKPKMPNGGLYPVGDYDRTLAPKKGNYLLPDINRPSYIDDEGGRRSEYKMGVNLDGRETVIPTVVNGRQLSEEEAIDRYQKTGLHMGKFDTPDQSEYASRLRTARYNMLENPVTFNAGMFEKGGKFLPTAIAQKLEHKPSKGLREAYKRRKRI